MMKPYCLVSLLLTFSLFFSFPPPSQGYYCKRLVKTPFSSHSLFVKKPNRNNPRNVNAADAANENTVKAYTYENYIKGLNRNRNNYKKKVSNVTTTTTNEEESEVEEELFTIINNLYGGGEDMMDHFKKAQKESSSSSSSSSTPNLKIIIKKSPNQQGGLSFEDIRNFIIPDNDDTDGRNSDDDDDDDVGNKNKDNNFEERPEGYNGRNDFWKEYMNKMGRSSSAGTRQQSETLSSKHFTVLKNNSFTFDDVGGYENVKEELMQCVDILKNYERYSKFNVRIPKGLLFEGPPGNGKTLMAKAFAGEANVSFISASGSEFQEMYVGVGAAKVRELFGLAKKNIPCIIFIDEFDAIGRQRSDNGERANTEKDNTLNELLVEMDGFKTQPGVFVIGSTNRVDLLDVAVVRPGRIDKKIFIGNPTPETRKKVVEIHIDGKPHDDSISIENIVDITEGFSCAEIENVLNEAMLYALRKERTVFTMDDVEEIQNKMIAGWQSSQHSLDDKMIEQICIHEIGHVLVGLNCKNHKKLKKVVLNLNSPNSPGYTLFDRSESSLYRYEGLYEHLMILLGGRIAEEIVYGTSITTGAINDFQESLKLVEQMILRFGFGDKIIYPENNNSEKYKEIVDNEIVKIIHEAYEASKKILLTNKDIIILLAKELQEKKAMKYEEIVSFIEKEHEKNNNNNNKKRWGVSAVSTKVSPQSTTPVTETGRRFLWRGYEIDLDVQE